MMSVEAVTIRKIPAILVVLPHGEGLSYPQYATPESAGADLYAAIEAPITLQAGERVLVPTGLIIELPKGFEGQIRPRSGLALKYGITVLNAPGTLDSDYRGEVGVILINLSQEPFKIERGMKIAQIIVSPLVHANWHELEKASSVTQRGEGGFGSTGEY